jgi:hypothetical protein
MHITFYNLNRNHINESKEPLPCITIWLDRMGDTGIAEQLQY